MFNIVIHLRVQVAAVYEPKEEEEEETRLPSSVVSYCCDVNQPLFLCLAHRKMFTSES